MHRSNRHTAALLLAIGALALVVICAAVMLCWTQNWRNATVTLPTTKTALATPTAGGAPAAMGPSPMAAADSQALGSLIRSADDLAALVAEIGKVKLSATALALSGLQGPVDDLQASRKQLESDLTTLDAALKQPANAPDREITVAAEEMNQCVADMQTQMDMLQQAKKDRDLAAVEAGLKALTAALQDADGQVNQTTALLK